MAEMSNKARVGDAFDELAKGLLPHLLALLALGGLQGGLGWFMVASGFSERTDVSQYRLVLHLGMAVVIYLYLVRVALGLRHPRRRMIARRSGLGSRRGWRSPSATRTR